MSGADHRPAAPRGIALMLAALSAIGPFSIDTYLPAFPDIGQTLSATPGEVQQTLSAYLLAFAVMTLWHGAIADRFGRRRVLLVMLALYGLASIGCLFAHSIVELWIWRALQGITAGAGTVVSRAIVRDLFDGALAQRLMSHVSMMFALAPAIAPVLGGWLHAAWGWRSIFAFLVLSTAGLWLACWRALPETLPPERRQSLHPGYLLRAYGRTLSAPPFLLACGAIATLFSGFFVYVLSAPVFLMQHLGISETGFFWLFGPATSGMILGSWLSGHLAGRRSRPQILRLGFALMGVAACVNLGLALAGITALPWPVLPFFLYTIGMSLSMPCLTLYALDPFPMQRGLAASCQTFLQAGFNGLVAALVAPAVWHTPTTLALTMLGFLGISALLAWTHDGRRTDTAD